MRIITARLLQVQNMLCSIVVLLAHVPLQSCLRVTVVTSSKCVELWHAVNQGENNHVERP